MWVWPRPNDMDINRPAPPLLSRILLAISALLVAGVVYVFASQALEEAPQPPPAPLKQVKSFNPQADISKNPALPTLEDNKPEVADMPLGRPNPFQPVNVKSGETATTSAQAVTVPGTGISVIPVAPAVEQTTSTEYE